MRQLLFSLALLAALPVVADSVRIEPPAPDTQSFIRVHASGVWPTGCVPAVREVTRAGNRIEVALESPTQICTTVLTPWIATANVGLLPAGVYDLVVTLRVQAGPPSEMARLTLIVRDRAAFSVVPAAASAAAPAAVELRRAAPWPPSARVFFGGREAAGVKADGGTLIATPPALAPGTVDVEVVADGTSQKAAAAFTVFDPASPPDPMLFEPLLFPVDFEGPGAFGSQWTTENVVSPAFGRVWFRSQLPLAGCRTCPSLLADKQRLRVDSLAGGRMLWIVRGSDPVWASSRIRDLSRSAQTAGTAVPVVRESDFRPGETWIVDVPAGERSRGMLRIYSYGEGPVQVAIGVHREKGDVVFRSATLTRATGEDPLYASLDLGTFGLTAGERVDIRLRTGDAGTPLWAMVSITNNETQQVTIASSR